MFSDLAFIPTTALVSLATLLLTWRFFLGICQAVGHSGYRVVVVGKNPSDCEPLNLDPRHWDFHRQLGELGFIALGVTQERTFGQRWDVENAYWHPSELCRASIYRLGGGAPRVCLTTAFQDDVFVESFNTALACDEFHHSDFISCRLPTQNLGELFETHRKNCVPLVQENLKPIRIESIGEWAAEVERVFRHPAKLAEFRSCWRALFVASVIMRGLIPALPSWNSGHFEPRTWSGCVLVLELMYVAGEYLVMKSDDPNGDGQVVQKS